MCFKLYIRGINSFVFLYAAVVKLLLEKFLCFLSPFFCFIFWYYGEIVLFLHGILIILLTKMANKYCRALLCLLFLHLSFDVVGQECISYNLHNWLVNEYLEMADEKYGETIGRSGISILDHERVESGDYFLTRVVHTDLYRKPNFAEQPSYVSFYTKGGDKLHVSEVSDFSKKQEFSVGTGDSTFVYNLQPQCVYWYRVLSGTAVVSEGVIKTLGQLRMLRVENVLNVRDLGGWKCTDGTSMIAYGKLFRGGTLDGVHDQSSQYVTPADRLKISTESADMLANQMGIKAEADLRGPNTGLSQSLIPNATYKVFSLRNYDSFLSETSYYSDIKNCLAYITDNLKANKPTYFHCEWGADRTGSLAMIIGALCGVKESDLVKDWELTSFSNHFSFKYISDGTDQISKMRKMFNYLYDKFDGASGKTLQEQATKWLREKVYEGKASTADDIIKVLKDNLVVSIPKSPILLKDWSEKYNKWKYSVVIDSQTEKSYTQNKCYNASGTKVDSDMFCITDLVECKNYSKVIVTTKTRVVGVCYDKSKNQVGVLANTDVVDEGSVIVGSAELSLPSGTRYISFNVPKYSGWSAVIK